MRFEINPPLIIFYDDQPGSHATLFAPNGQRLRFRGDKSSFSDNPPSYAWAFEGKVQEGDRIVFATSDREILGIVRANDVDAQVLSSGQVMHAGDKPTALTGELLPTVEALLRPPHPDMPPRPIPMRRSTTDEPVVLSKAPVTAGPWVHVGGIMVRCPRGVFRALSHEDAAYIAKACDEYPRLVEEIKRLKG